MKTKTMTTLLHAVLLVAALLGGGFFFAALPAFGRQLAVTEAEFAWAYWPCLIWAWCFAVPIFAALIPAWQVFSSISAPEGAFTRTNARCLRWIAYLAFADGVIFPAGMLIVAALGAGQPGLTLVITPVVMFCCVAVGIAALCLGHLVGDAAELKEDSDLTI